MIACQNESPDVRTARASEQNKTDSGDFAATVADRQEKTQATVFAEAALRGVSVYPLADGTFIASRWGWIKPCADLSAVQRLVRQLGGAQC
jgi:hypothetical protein